MSTEVASLSAVFTANTSNLMSGITQAENRLSGFATNLGTSMQTAGQSMTALGRKATMLSGVMAIPLIAGVKAAIDFESAFAGVVKTVDGTDDQLNTLRNTILQMATDSTNPLAGLDDAQVTLARIMELGGQLGVPLGDLEQFTQTIGMLTLATDMTADSASTMLAQFANITGMSFDDFDNLGATIVDLGNNSATTESQIVEFMQRIAGAGTSFNISPAFLAGFSAEMASLGLNAEAGGTAFTTMLSTMSDAVVSNAGELKEFAWVSGMSASQFADAWNSPDGPTEAITAFIAGLGDMTAAQREMTLESLGLDGTRTADMLRRMSGDAEGLVDKLGLATTAWGENNALTSEAEKRFATTKAQLNLFKNTVNGLAIEIGGALLPALNSLLKDARPLLETFGKFIQDNPQLVKTFTAIAIGVGVLGAVLVPLGLTISALGAIFGLFGAILTSAVLGPILLLGAILGGLALAAYATNFLGFGDAVRSVGDAFREGGASAGAAQFALGIVNALQTFHVFDAGVWVMNKFIIPINNALTDALTAGINITNFAINLGMGTFNAVAWVAANIIIPLVMAVPNLLTLDIPAFSLNVLQAFDAVLFVKDNFFDPVANFLLTGFTFTGPSISFSGGGLDDAATWATDYMITPIIDAFGAGDFSRIGTIVKDAINAAIPNNVSISVPAVSFMGAQLYGGGNIGISIPDPFATGGIFHAGQDMLVGEKGPELVSFPSSGRVTSNNRLNTAPPSGSVGNGGSSVLNINGGTFVLQGVQNIDDLYAQLQQKAQRTVGAYRP